MDKEKGSINTIVRRVALGVTAAIALSGLGVLMEKTPQNQDSTTKSRDIPEEHLIRVPCTEPMPWEAPGTENNDQGQTGEIKLASIKLPEPAPNRNQPECWIIVKDNDSGTIFEN